MFDLANPSAQDYVTRRPYNYRSHPNRGYDLSKPVPGNYHYMYARELSPAERESWKAPRK